MIALMPAVALVLYQALGAPGLPARPYAARAAAPILQSSVEELIARVEARLLENPGDGAGWDAIAPVYLRQERFREAADAFAAASRLLGPSAKRLAGFAEASIMSQNGIVGEAAKSAYEQVLKLEPGHLEARFWLALAKEQDGALADAAADYRALLAKTGPNVAWRRTLQERLAGIDEKLAVATGKAGAGSDLGRGVAPDADAAASMARLPPDQRLQAIGSMVDGLAARLKQDSRDLNGWLRLVRAYKVLGRDDAAAAALIDARNAMHGDMAALGALDALARSLGIGS